jgi:hypothetical protein
MRPRGCGRSGSETEEIGHQLQLVVEHVAAEMDAASGLAGSLQKRGHFRLHDDFGDDHIRLQPRYIEGQRVGGAHAERGAVDQKVVAGGVRRANGDIERRIGLLQLGGEGFDLLDGAIGERKLRNAGFGKREGHRIGGPAGADQIGAAA